MIAGHACSQLFRGTTQQRVLESAEILEMNGYYQTLVASMHKWSQDASILLHGEAVFFLDLPTVEVLFGTAY